MSFFSECLLGLLSIGWLILPCSVFSLWFFPPAADPEAPVFEMLYERNPAHSHFERRLHVSTRPLNIIYNPQAIKKVADFFYKGKVHTSG